MSEERPANISTLIAPNAYHLVLGLKVGNVKEEISDASPFPFKEWVSDSPVEISGVTFTLHALRHRGFEQVLPHLVLGAETEMKVKVTVRASVLCPAGAVLKTFNWRQFEVHIRCAPCVDSTGILHEMNFAVIDSEGWLFDGNLHISAEVFVEAQQLPPSSGIPVGRIINSMTSEIKNPTLSDFVLISADGHQIKAHKLVLAAISPVFRAMFATDCQETRDGCCKIEDADEETINAMFAGICDGNVSGLSFELLKNVFQLADKYEMMELKESCATKLSEWINLDNLLDVLMLADKHSALKLKTQGFLFLENNLLEATTQDIPLKLNSANKELYEEWTEYLRKRPSQKRPAAAPVDDSAKRARALF